MAISSDYGMTTIHKDNFVSVIIPAYNRAVYIGESIESVLTQTYKNFEIIVVDDGSTDNTKEVVKKYGADVRYIYQENKGPSAARNNGIKHAKGSLIAFLDSDDLWLPNKLESQVEIFCSNSAVGIIGTGFLSCNEHMQTRHQILEKRLNSTAALRAVILVRNIWPTPTIMVRMECFDCVGLFDEAMMFAEDWDMWIRIAMKYEAAHIFLPLAKVRMHSANITSSYSLENFRIWRDLLYHNRTRYSMRTDIFCKALSWLYFNISYYYQTQQNKNMEREFILKSLLVWPFYLPKRIFTLIRTFAFWRSMRNKAETRGY